MNTPQIPSDALPAARRRRRQRSFTPGLIWTLVSLGVCSWGAYSLWTVLVDHFSREILIAMVGDEHGRSGVASPFASLVQDSPFSPTPALDLARPSASAEAVHELGRKIATGEDEVTYLAQALHRMNLRDATGQLLPEEKLTALARHFAFIFGKRTPDGQSLFSLPALETLALFAQKSTLNPSREKQAEADQIQARRNLARRLAEQMALPGNLTKPAAIVSAALDFAGLQTQLKLPIVPATSLSDGDGPGTAEFERQNWPLLHQVLVRIVEMTQVDDAVRAARFRLTFVEGPDQFVMYGLALLVCALLLGRAVKLYRSHREWHGPAMRRTRAAFRRCNGQPEEEPEVIIHPGEAFRQSHPPLHWIASDMGQRLRRIARKAKSLHFALFRRRACAAPLSFIRQMRAAAFGRYARARATPDMIIVRGESFRESNARSRWLIGYLSKAIPTIGFTAKVFGIARAMQNADAIARAVGPYAQSAAIAQISGALGIAFTATVSAFSLCLVLAYLDAVQSHREGEFIGEVESGLLDDYEKLLPNRHHPQPPGETHASHGIAQESTLTEVAA